VVVVGAIASLGKFEVVAVVLVVVVVLEAGTAEAAIVATAGTMGHLGTAASSTIATAWERGGKMLDCCKCSTNAPKTGYSINASLHQHCIACP
jgi:hypothetical protein